MNGTFACQIYSRFVTNRRYCQRHAKLRHYIQLLCTTINGYSFQYLENSSRDRRDEFQTYYRCRNPKKVTLKLDQCLLAAYYGIRNMRLFWLRSTRITANKIYSAETYHEQKDFTHTLVMTNLCSEGCASALPSCALRL